LSYKIIGGAELGYFSGERGAGDAKATAPSLRLVTPNDRFHHRMAVRQLCSSGLELAILDKSIYPKNELKTVK
jgi:hypothetical protein